MLTNKKSNTSDQSQHRCLSCGTTEDMKDRRYCSLKCRQQLRQKLNTRSGLLQALNTRYATFYFSDTMITMDVVPHGIKEIFRYTSLRSAGNSPADDFSQMTNMMGNAWWEEENRTARKYLASRHVLELAERCTISPLLLRPKLIKVPTIKTRAMIYLKIDKAHIASDDLSKIIKNAYRRQAKIHHPDMGGHAQTFRKLHAAYVELLRWADNPTFIRRRGFPDKWYYDSDNQKWVQPIPVGK
ncbi:MAG: J domain-containing protein [Deltaproteobacteria bacterium]